MHCSGGSHPQKVDWKAEVKQEIMAELKDQLKDLTQELLREVKPKSLHRQTYHTPQCEPDHRRGVSSNPNMWSADGKPIYRCCRQAGHIARFCRNHRQPKPPLN